MNQLCGGRIAQFNALILPWAQSTMKAFRYQSVLHCVNVFFKLSSQGVKSDCFDIEVM